MLRSTNGEKEPYLFRLDGPAVQPGNDGDREKEWQGQVLTVQHGGQGEHCSTKERGPRSQEHPQDDHGFKTDIGGVEVGHDEANPHAQGQWDTKEASSPTVWPVVRRSANKRRWKVRALAVTADTAAATPSLISSDMRTILGSYTLLLYGQFARLDMGRVRGSNWDMPLEGVKKVADADFPTRWGHFRILGFEGTRIDPDPCTPGTAPVPAKIEGAIALVLGDIHAGPPVVRIHSQCLTGDVFGSLRCDCRLQLELAMRAIAQAGTGILLYEQQEGRGIGLMAKLRAYELQDEGLDTVEANLRLGFKPDCREFELPAEILKLLHVSSVRLITNNPDKVEALEAVGVRVVERISAEVEPLESFERYVQVKQEKMGHIIDRALNELG